MNIKKKINSRFTLEHKIISNSLLMTCKKQPPVYFIRSQKGLEIIKITLKKKKKLKI